MVSGPAVTRPLPWTSGWRAVIDPPASRVISIREQGCLDSIRDGDRVEALALRDGRIVAAGNRDEMLPLKGANTRMVDLKGRALLPGFIDAHSHGQRIEETRPEPGKWVFGWGYGDTGVAERRHPTREDLDAVSTAHPILLMHISSHLMTANSKALELAGITAARPHER